MRERLTNVAWVVAFVLCCCAASTVITLVATVVRDYPLVVLALVAGGVGVRWAVRAVQERRLLGQLAADEWVVAAADRPWPWRSLLERVGDVAVVRAWDRTVDGLLVTVGEITWENDALRGAVKGWSGRGVFVVVTLPLPTEPMALRRDRVIGVSHRLDFPAVRDAFENGEIPPWTAKDDSLFTFDAISGRPRAEEVRVAVRRTLLVVRLLDLGPD